MLMWLPPGIGSPIAALYGPASSWIPSNASVALAAWFDPSDITTLFKDTGGTQPVAADGDLVLRMNDKSGNGWNATMPYGNGSAVVYRTGGGKPYLEVVLHHWLETTAHQFVNATDGTHSTGLGWVASDNIGTQRLTQQGTSLAGVHNNAGTAEGIVLLSTGSTNTDPGLPITVGTSTSLIKVATATTVEIFVNNATNGATTLSNTLSIGTMQMGLMGSPGGAGYASGHYYGSAHYSGALSSGDRTSLNTFLLGKMP